MADTKLSALATFTPILGDYVYGVDDPGGTPISGALTLSAIMTLYEAQISLATSRITSGTFADARIAASNVTQHEAALSITESQISDLGSYITDVTGDNLSALADVTITTIGTGEILKWNGAAWINNTLAEAGIQASGSYLTDVVGDTSPQLGGNLDVNGNSIVSTSNGAITLAPNGTGNVILGNFEIDADQTLGAGTDNYVLTYDNASGTWSAEATGSGSLNAVVDDTTPQLGGSLDVNGQKIVSVSNGNIDIEPHGTGNVLLGNFTFDADQTVGAGQDNYVFTYDNGTGLISLEASAGGGGDLWSDPVDSSITVDTHNTYDVATDAARLKDIYQQGTLYSDAGAITSGGLPGTNGLNVEWLYTNYGLGVDANGSTVFFVNNSAKSSAGTHFKLGDTGYFGWGASSHVGSSTSIDTRLYRDAANTLALRNSTNAQEFRVYNTWTDASNNEYMALDWATNVAVIDVVENGTGTQRNLSIRHGGTEQILVDGTDVDVTNLKVTGSLTEEVYTITDGAAFEVDPHNGTIQVITLTASRTPKATNFENGQSLTLMVDDGTAYTITWTDATWGTGGVTWVGGTAPTLATTGYTVITFWKVAGETYGSHTGDVA